MRSVEAGSRREIREILREGVLLLPRLLRLLFRLMRDPRVNKADKVLVAAAVAYVVNPLDFIPDFLPALGQADDLFAVCLVLLRLIADSGEIVIRDNWTGAQELIPWIYNISRLSRLFLPDRVVRSIRMRFG